MSSELTVGLIATNALVRVALVDYLDRNPEISVQWHASSIDQVPRLPESVGDTDLVLCVIGHESAGEASAMVRSVRDHASHVRVLVVAPFPFDPALGQVITAGVDGVIAEHSGMDGLLDAIEAVRNGTGSTASLSALRILQGWTAQRDGEQARLGGFAHLTPREMEVLRAMADGKSDQQIAEQLFIGLPTVRTHVTHLLDKTNSESRLQVVVRALEVGVLPMPTCAHLNHQNR